MEKIEGSNQEWTIQNTLAILGTRHRTKIIKTTKKMRNTHKKPPTKQQIRIIYYKSYAFICYSQVSIHISILMLT